MGVWLREGGGVLRSICRADDDGWLRAFGSVEPGAMRYVATLGPVHILDARLIAVPCRLLRVSTRCWPIIEPRSFTNVLRLS